MAFNINEFTSHFDSHQTYSKASKFEVFVFPPDVISGGLFDRLKLTIGRGGLRFNMNSSRGLRFQCETAELPGYNLNTVDGRVYGASYAVAATPVFNELSLSFICAADLWEKEFFDDWQNAILPKDRYGYKAQYRDSYVSNIEVRQFHETGDLAAKYTFLEAFPSSVSPISLSWGSDEINRLNVTFKYARWEKKVGVELTDKIDEMINKTTRLTSIIGKLNGK
jgi:hypothetical protein